MVVDETWHAECRSCDVSRTCAANVMLCRPSQDVSHCSHNSGVRVHACNVTCPITALQSSGADKCAKVRAFSSRSKIRKKTTACSLCAAHEKCSHHAEGQEQHPEPQVCRWATPFCDFDSMQFFFFVGQLSSAFQLACAGFCSAVGALICSKLRTGHRK